MKKKSIVMQPKLGIVLIFFFCETNLESKIIVI